MRFVSTRLHGVMDYAWGASLLLAPRLLHPPPSSAAMRTAKLAGGGAIAYAALTDYELGLVPALAMREYVVPDLAGGAALAASPWAFGFTDRIRWLHVAVGPFAVTASLVTWTQAEEGAWLSSSTLTRLGPECHNRREPVPFVARARSTADSRLA